MAKSARATMRVAMTPHRSQRTVGATVGDSASTVLGRYPDDGQWAERLESDLVTLRERTVTPSAMMGHTRPDRNIEDRTLGDEFVTAATAARLRLERGLERLLIALQAEDWHERAAAARVLGERRAHRAVERLLSALNDEDPDVRTEAAYALGLLDDRIAVEPLMAILEEGDEHFGPQQAAADVLGDLGDPRATATLFALLRRSEEESLEPDLLVSAACSLAALGDRRAVEPLLKIADDEEAWEPSDQAAALGALADLGFREPLLEAVDDQRRSGHMRELAAEELASRRESPRPGPFGA